MLNFLKKTSVDDSKYESDKFTHDKFFENFGHDIKHSGVISNYGVFKLILNNLHERISELEKQQTKH